MLSKWRYSTLGEIAASGGGGLVDGPFGSNLPASDYVCDGVPVIRGSNLTLGTARFVDDEFAFVSQATAERLSRSLCEAGDIVFTKKGTLGQTGFVPEGHRYPKFLLSSNQMKLTVDRSIADPLFVYYYVSSDAARSKIVQDSTQTGVPKTNVAYLKNFPILLPPLDEQQRIATLLNALDDKIEQNRRTGRALEKLARAIFRAWFVDFEPVHAKAAGATSFPSMPQSVFDELPSRFIDSTIGAIPEGWVPGVFGAIGAERRDGVKPADINPSTPYIGLEHMPRRCISLANWDQAGKVTSGKTRFTAGEILFGKLRPYFHKVGIASVDGICSTDIIVIKPTMREWYGVLLGYISSDELVAYTNACSTGTKMPRTKWSDISQYTIVMPPLSFAKAFTEMAESMTSLMISGIFESRKLAELRDYLLPKLLSGQVRVRDAEKWVDDPAGFAVAEYQSAAAATRTRVSVQCNLTGAGDSQDGLGDDDQVQVGEPGSGVAVAEADDEPPSMSIAGRSSVPIESWSTEEVMAAFRKAARNRGAMPREELLQRVAQRLGYQRLGYQRLGNAIRERLKNHLRAALRRHIIAADGPELVVAETTSMGDYELDELVDVLRSVMRKGQAMQREDVIRAVASHLGFTRLVDSVQAPIKSAINAGIRRGILQYDRNTLWRVV